MNQAEPQVGIVMGSDSDWPKIRAVGKALREFDVPFEVRVMSAHRTPELVADYAAKAESRGLKVIIAAAGGAAHLGGVIAAHSAAARDWPARSHGGTGWTGFLALDRPDAR